MSAAAASFATGVPVRLAAVLAGVAEVHVLHAGHLDAGRLAAHGVKVHRSRSILWRFAPLRWVGIMVAVARVTRRWRIDIVMNVWDHYSLFPLAAGARLGGRTLVARIAGTPIGSASPRTRRAALRRKLGLFLERRSLELADGVVAVSQSLADTFAARGIPASRIQVISQGCDVDRFRPGERTESHRVLYVGRLVPKKGLDRLLEAVSILGGRDVACECVLAGEGPERERLGRRAEELGIADAVRFLGHVEAERLPELYRSAAALVLPSHDEGLPNVVLEALACGTPVIASAVGAVPELLADGRGQLIDGSPHQLADAIARVLTGPGPRDAPRNGREYVVAQHSFEALRERYEGFFRSLAAR